MLDLVIRGGLVVDGTGASAFCADIGIRGDRIVEIGRVTERGRREIDAAGCIVAPGFVEIHTHLDAQILWDGLGTSSAWQGITTAVMGNCGFTLAPCAADDKDLCLRSLERAEDMSREVLLAGIDWTWESFPEYLDAVDRRPKGINCAAMIGHSAVRTYVMGERAYEAEAGDDEVELMHAHVVEALRRGAFGFTTSRADHRTADDRPVASRVGPWGEVCALASALCDVRHGVFEVANHLFPDVSERRRYQDALGELAVAIGRPVAFASVSTPAIPDLCDEYFELAERVAPRGGRLHPQVTSKELGALQSFQTQLCFDSLPGWQHVRARPLDAQRAALLDPAIRRDLVTEAEHGTYPKGLGTEPPPPAWDRMRVFDPSGARGPSIGELATARRVSPVEVVIDLALEHDLDVFFHQPYANLSDERVLFQLRHPRSVIASSDTGAHVSQICDTSIPTHFLAYWVREREAFSWEDAVRMLTFVPASFMGFADRGVLREGFAADVTVFDPGLVSPGRPRVARDLPSGGLRLVQKAEGIPATVVGGEPLTLDGEHTGAMPGRLLRAGSVT